MPAAETKYVDGYLDDTGLQSVNANDSTWASTELNPRQATAVYGCLPVPKQGTGYADRDGRRIYVKDIKIRGIITFIGGDGLVAAGSPNANIRLIVVKDTRTNGVGMSAENAIGPGLGSDGNASLTADAALTALTNPDGWGRYVIMKDKYYRASPLSAFNDGTDGAVNTYSIPFKLTVKCNCYVNFSATTGVVGSIVDNSFHLLAAFEGSNATPSVTYVARTSFMG